MHHPADCSPSAHAGPVRRVVLLLALATFLNYIDRGSLSTAAPLLKDDLGFDNVQIGLLLSAFFWSYTPTLLLAGWAMQRFDARIVMAAGLSLWAAATILTGFASGFVVLFGLRLLLGLGESVMFPGFTHILAQYAGETWRGRVNGIIVSGSPLGSAFGTLVGGLLIAQFGWRVLFVVVGLATLLWLIPWLERPLPVAEKRDAGADGVAPSVGRLLSCRALWGASLGQFGFNYSLYFTLAWLPMYLVKGSGFSVPQMAAIGGVVYLVKASSAIVAGLISDRCIRAGVSPNVARKTCAVTGALGLSLSMSLCASAGPNSSLVLLVFAGAFMGISAATNFAIAQTLAGPSAAGRWMGIQSCIGNIAGILAPVLTGYIVERSGTYYGAFLVAGAVAAIGALGYGLVIERVEPVRWIRLRAARPPLPTRRRPRSGLLARASK